MAGSNHGASRRRSSTTCSERGVLSIAEDLIARDDEDIAEPDSDTALSRTSTRERMLGKHALTSQHRRPSYVSSSPRPFLGLQSEAETTVPTDNDLEATIQEETDLLRDNKLLPNPTETTPLLSDNVGQGNGVNPSPDEIQKTWEDAVMAGKIKTTWRREGKVIVSTSFRLMLTSVLQVSLTFTSIFTAGHLGKNELAAVSLGGMTAVITGYSVYYGLSTSLDTMCAQAYGSGRPKLVGLYLQRMVCFLWTSTVPIAIVWSLAPQILMLIVPEKDIAQLAGNYLRILIFGAPAFACFEASKRYVQAQGRFNITLGVLAVVAPSNVLLQYIFVWRFGWGFMGCPTAIVIVQNMMPLLMFVYVRVFVGLDCWPGFTRKAFANWGPMVALALPGFVMLFAEIIAFEVITLAAAQMSATHLAANSILQSVMVLAFQLPLPLSIAGSTRVANLIGASLPEAAKVTAKVVMVVGAIVGSLNMVLQWTLRDYIPLIYTNEPDVIALAAATLPVTAAFQLFDSLATQCNGILRGLGRQKIGGYICLVTFYGIAIPISFGTAFGLHWDLFGLWCGPAVALLAQTLLVGTFISRTSWERASQDAARRNASG